MVDDKIKVQYSRRAGRGQRYISDPFTEGEPVPASLAAARRVQEFGSWFASPARPPIDGKATNQEPKNKRKQRKKQQFTGGLPLARAWVLYPLYTVYRVHHEALGARERCSAERNGIRIRTGPAGSHLATAREGGEGGGAGKTVRLVRFSVWLIWARSRAHVEQLAAAAFYQASATRTVPNVAAQRGLPGPFFVFQLR